jgi:hypothetical protein
MNENTRGKNECEIYKKGKTLPNTNTNTKQPEHTQKESRRKKKKKGEEEDFFFFTIDLSNRL